MSNSKPLIISLSIVSVAVMVLFGGYFFKAAMKTEQLPVYGKVQAFSLVDQKGEAFSMNKLRGKVWVADFFFTTCVDICPIMSKNMADLSRTFEAVPGVKFVSFTVNPENDSPEVLQAYADKLEKGKDNWYFLTGERAEIKKVAVGSFKLGDIKEPVFHSSKFPLVDRNGHIRGYYDGTDTADVSRLFKDASALLKERF